MTERTVVCIRIVSNKLLLKWPIQNVLIIENDKARKCNIFMGLQINSMKSCIYGNLNGHNITYEKYVIYLIKETSL